MYYLTSFGKDVHLMKLFKSTSCGLLLLKAFSYNSYNEVITSCQTRLMWNVCRLRYVFKA